MKGYWPGHGDAFDAQRGVYGPDGTSYGTLYGTGHAIVPGPQHGNPAVQGEFGEFAEARGFEGEDGSWEFDEDLAQLLQSAAPESDVVREPVVVRPRVSRRRRRRWWAEALAAAERLSRVPWLKLLSLLIAAATAVIVAMVSVLGGVIAYDPLRRLAAPAHPGELAGWWPLLVYGPWLVASLSIVRAAVHRRTAAHSWLVVVLFSAIAVYLCVAHTARTVTGMAVAGLPPVTALVSFHQLVRQITLNSPTRQPASRPRHSVNRGHGSPRR